MNEKNVHTPEDLLQQATTDKAWNITRIYRVADSKRSAHVIDIEPSQLGNVRMYLSQTFGAGDFDLENAQVGKNVKGKQCRVSIDVDRRPPHLQQSAGALVPSNVMPGGFPAMPGGFPPQMMPPWWMQQQQPQMSPEIAAMKEMMARMQERLAAQQEAHENRREDFTQTLLRDLLMERNRAGTQFLQEQRSTWEQAFQFGQKIKGGGDGFSVAGLLPLVDRVARAFEARGASAAASSPAATPDMTAALVAFVKASITNRVAAKVALAQARALFGEDLFAQLVQQREAFIDHFLADPGMEPLRTDAFAKTFMLEAVEALDRAARGEHEPPPSTTTTTTTTTTAPPIVEQP